MKPVLPSVFLSPDPTTGQRAGQADVVHFMGPLLLLPLMQREEER